MDELDRIYRRLVQNIRAAHPDLLTRSFEVSLLYQQLVPYRLNRRELGFDSNDEYELAMMQLLSGARGLLAGDPEMQESLRKELESPNPDLGAFRAYATSTVSLVPEALRVLDAQPMRRAAPAPSPEVPLGRPPAAAQLELAARATEELPVPPAHPPRPASAAPAPAPARPRAAGPLPDVVTARPTPVGCRYCGGELPDGREVNFCPHCGQNLTVKQCPACGAEMEIDWRFCVICGRQAD